MAGTRYHRYYSMICIAKRTELQSSTRGENKSSEEACWSDLSGKWIRKSTIWLGNWTMEKFLEKGFRVKPLYRTFTYLRQINKIANICSWTECTSLFWFLGSSTKLFHLYRKKYKSFWNLIINNYEKYKMMCEKKKKRKI